VDALWIDGVPNGSAKLSQWFGARASQLQTGYLYHYAFAMITGLLVMLGSVYMLLLK
jgi:NADH-quinone oxidoreductase subunit L